MKIRNGFVSNSSAASFCIYGWNEEDLNKDYYEIKALAERIGEKLGKTKIQLTSASKYEVVMGVGNVAYDFDHLEEWTYNWEQYKCDLPADEEKKKLLEIAKEMGLPKPKLFSETFWN